jgi:outer membrane murein-binding lipoprotein Lpp
MQQITKRSLGLVLLAGSLTCIGYLAAKQGPSEQSKGTQRTPPQQINPSRDQLEQLETQVKDLRSALDNLSMVRAQDREGVQEVQRTLGQDEKRIDKLGQQVSKIMFDLDRVKTKVGLY